MKIFRNMKIFQIAKLMSPLLCRRCLYILGDIHALKKKAHMTANRFPWNPEAPSFHPGIPYSYQPISDGEDELLANFSNFSSYDGDFEHHSFESEYGHNSSYSSLDLLDPEIQYNRFCGNIMNSSTLSNLNLTENDPQLTLGYEPDQEFSPNSSPDSNDTVIPFHAPFRREDSDILGSSTLSYLNQRERESDNQPRCFTPYFEAPHARPKPSEEADDSEIVLGIFIGG